MNITKTRLLQLISEEMMALDSYKTSYEDAYNADEEMKLIFERIQEASSIIEDLPFDDLPKQVEVAAQNLRTSLDLISKRFESMESF